MGNTNARTKWINKRFFRGATAAVLSMLVLLLPLRFALAETENEPQTFVVIVTEISESPQETVSEPAASTEPLPGESAATPAETAALPENEVTPNDPAITPAPANLPETSPEISAQTVPESTDQAETSAILVANEYVFYSSDADLATSLCSQYGGVLLRWSDGLGVMYCEGLSGDCANIFFPQEILMVSSAPYYTQEGESVTNVAAAQELAPNSGAGVLIAVIDSGIDLDHPALVDSISEAVSVIPDSAYGEDGYFYEGYLGAQDYLGHGSHVSGILTGQTDEMTLGIAPGAQILSIKALEKYGSSAAGTTEWLIRAILLAIARNADIINLSVGGSRNYVSAAQTAFQQAADAGILVVCATGNYAGGPVGVIDYPAAYNNTLAVSSVTVDGGDISLSDFSRYGTGTDLSAPGVAIYSCDANGSYQSLSGTSMSCAIVSGVAAMLLSQSPDLSPEELIRLMERSATDAGTVGYDTRFGWGVVNAENALKLLRSGSTSSGTNQEPQQEEHPVPAPAVPAGQEIPAAEDWLTTQQGGALQPEDAQTTPEIAKTQPFVYILLLLAGIVIICILILTARRKRTDASGTEQV